MVNATDLDTTLLASLSTTSWMSRSEIAIRIGRFRNTLNYQDIAHLNLLSDRGLIEERVVMGALNDVFSYRRPASASPAAR